jgi:hypothetical protein
MLSGGRDYDWFSWLPNVLIFRPDKRIAPTVAAPTATELPAATVEFAEFDGGSWMLLELRLNRPGRPSAEAGRDACPPGQDHHLAGASTPMTCRRWVERRSARIRAAG